MTHALSAPTPTDEFIRRWESSGAAERANYALFLAELCDLLNVPRPEPSRPDDSENGYVFERAVTFQNGDGSTSPGRIDLYKRGCFVLEAKQGSERPEGTGDLILPRRPKRRGTAVRGTAGWDDAMLAARGQAEQYVRALPASEPNPPFLIVVDVGHSIELLADFTRQGRTYTPFPDALSHRVKLADLADESTRERLRLVWTDPLNLDPSRRSAKVTRKVADRLAKLAVSLEKSEYSAEAVAQFLMRCIFTFFAEDVGLLPKESFTNLLRSLRDRKETALFPKMVRSLWETMKTGGFSPILRAQVLRFNGGLFESAEALPVTDEQLELLVQAGEKEWRDVEPAIFGTLLERALNPIERHKLGAHYTPRAYVERLVMPTIIEPLRDEWANVQTAAVLWANEGDLPKARDEVRSFLRKLCDIIVLDPACGTGNFLYVTLEHMKRLEGEVRDALRGFGETQSAFEGFGLTVDPHQFRGIEINPRAAAIADLVLWIGYLQWHFRTFGAKVPAEPIIKAVHNIECRDAVLAYESREPMRDERGEIVTRWDGISIKRHPITGEEVPDETGRQHQWNYIKPRRADWPNEAHYVIGNPPFIGNKRMRSALGDGYVKALRSTWDEVPETVDFVMYWWQKAAELSLTKQLKRFGFITTNSITQPFNRKTIARAIERGVSLAFAIPDHPWVDEKDGAAVRVAMTVAQATARQGRVLKIVEEPENGELLFTCINGTINSDLTVGVDISTVQPLRANSNLSFMGMIPLGAGFWVTLAEAQALGFGSDGTLKRIIRPYRNGQDITSHPRNIYVVDFFGYTLERVRSNYPSIYQWLIERVKPQRDQDNRASYRENWWYFAEARPAMRAALSGLNRYIVTVETSRRRFFEFTDSEIVPDQKLRVVASDDPLILGTLSSRAHLVWALFAGSRLGIGNDPVYNNSRCFEPFPFPIPNPSVAERIRRLADELDAHRKHQRDQYVSLTMSAFYTILAKLRSGEPLTDKERTIHEQGLVSVLKQIHDDLDAAVFDAYGWPRDLKDEEILQRLVDLNRERAAEEARGVIRWLRPEFQNPGGAKAATQTTLIPLEPEPALPDATPAKKQPWPNSMAEQAQAVRAALSAVPAGMTPAQLAKTFLRGQAKRVSELLDTLVSLGQARELEDGRYVRV